MTVYADIASASYGRMKMRHMIADSEEELHHMAHLIGVDRKWYQGPPKTKWSHYDIALSKKAKAISLGAVIITQKESIGILKCQKLGIDYSSPKDALEKYRNKI